MYNFKSINSGILLLTIFLLFIFLNFDSYSQQQSGPVWTSGRYFPTFPEAKNVYIANVQCPIGWTGGAWEPTWRINQSPEIMSALTLVCMQGIVNRYEPRIFIHYHDVTGHYPDDYQGVWKEQIKNYVTTSELGYNNDELINFFYTQFSDLFSGIVIYDPAVPETINLATMIAGLQNRIVLSPQQAGANGMPNLSDVYDLRDLVAQNNWDDSFESQLKIYQWVYDNLWPNLEHRIIGVESPGPPTSVDKETPDGKIPIGIATRDYLVALKLPVLYLNPKYGYHKELFEKFVAEAPSPVPITGAVAFNEDDVTKLASSYGGFCAGLTWPGEPVSSANLSLLSGIRVPILKLGDEINPNRILATLGNKPVTTMYTSDGDALFLQMIHGFHFFFIWEDVKDQQFGWEMNPLLSEIAPVIWNYYLNSRTKASFIDALSGCGYAYPQVMDENELASYLQIAKTYLDDTGLRVVRVDGRLGPWTENFAHKYYDILHDSGYLGAIIAFQSDAKYGFSLDYFGRPAPAIKPAYTLEPNNMNLIIDDLLGRKPNETTIEITSQGGEAAITTVNDPDASDGEAMKITPEFKNSPNCCLTFFTGEMGMMPGDYTFTFRLKVTDNSSSGIIARPFIGERYSHPDWRNLYVMDIAASDFQQSNVYQEFSFTYSFPEYTKDIEVRLDYGDGSTDLYADNVIIINSSNNLLPAFNPLYLSLAVSGDQHDGMNTLAGNFKTEFESRGGLVLNPNEFFASLNPEYMIEYAKSYLSAGDSAIAKAQNEMNEGKYINSLLTIREALKSVVSIQDNMIPLEFALYQNYPNPFNPSTTIRYQITKRGNIQIKIFDVLGRLIKVLVDEEKPAGNYYINFDGSNLASGVYFYQLITDSKMFTKKLVLLK